MGPLTDDVDPRPFVVFGLPRSRTKWLSVFLSYGGWTCHHDLPIKVNDLSEMKDLLSQPLSGTVDTGLSRSLMMILDWFPKAKIAVVVRDIEEIQQSAAAVGWTIDPFYLALEAAMLQEISKRAGVLTVSFDQLKSEEGCKSIFEHCLQMPFDQEWWMEMADANIQIDMKERLRGIDANKDRALRVFSQINSYVHFNPEGFDTVYRDGQELFAAHIEEADNGAEPNYYLLEKAWRAGALSIYTMRTPTSLVGYISFFISPSFSNGYDIEALQGAWYIKNEYRGRYAKRFHEFARKKLKELGVTKLAMKAGIDADGPKMHSFYKKIGAEHIGTLYSLSLKD